MSRGIQILETLAAAGEPLSIDETARALGVHRSNAYRLVRTLEAHGVVVRDPAGMLALGPRLAALAAGVQTELQSAALPELTAVASELAMTCFVAVYDRGECVTLTSVEPPQVVATVSQRPGTRHFVGLGAPGRAILSQLPTDQWPVGVGESARADVRLGGSVFSSYDEVIDNLRSLAVPLALRGQAPAAVGVVFISSDHGMVDIGHRLEQAVNRITAVLDG